MKSKLFISTFSFSSPIITDLFIKSVYEVVQGVCRHDDVEVGFREQFKTRKRLVFHG